jgi:hypothetical protein
MVKNQQDSRDPRKLVAELTPAWVKTADAVKLIGLSPSCLKNYRLKQGYLIEGIHWVYTNSGHRMILYNVELLCDWVANRASPEQHLRTIEAYLVAQSKQDTQGRHKKR